MNEHPRTDSSEHRGPDGHGWADAQRRVADRNDRARKAGKQEREDYERRRAALHRAARDKA